MNTGIDLLLGIIQTGIIFEFRKYGIEYTPND
ncbi:hypothetical protein SAMN04488696_1804 [Methanolobus profundi]|uniref:Uncharacterized protein n=1 Tax=Methanolobus profundi TaxID=487685 RepID=A0A1I4S6J0_9EURY|nr:hypothetical protein SAMN04488696_1804 [Methanolobus profundi]